MAHAARAMRPQLVSGHFIARFTHHSHPYSILYLTRLSPPRTLRGPDFISKRMALSPPPHEHARSLVCTSAITGVRCALTPPWAASAAVHVSDLVHAWLQSCPCHPLYQLHPAAGSIFACVVLSLPSC